MKGRNIVPIAIILIVTTLVDLAHARILDRTRLLNGTSRLIPQLAVNGNSSITNWPETIKGISLGGWLVTEPFITPSLYWSAKHASYKHARSNVSIVDEYTMCQAIGQERARYLLTKHYNKWITKKDIQDIKKRGFNLVRIPVGYWAWKQIGSIDRYVNNITYYDPFVGGVQLPYLHRALNWCKDAGLKVWVDLHGAPGSQNGFDNSGQRIFEHEGDLNWLKKNGTRELTVEIIKSIYYDLAGGEWKDVIAGIEVLNEPMGSRLGIGNVTSFYNETVDEFVKSGLKTPLVIHDAFEPLGYWNSYRNSSSDPTIYIDHHHYEVFSYPQLENDHYGRLESVANYGESLSKERNSHQAVVGEWSGAMTDCATWLNGIGIGSRYGGTYYDKFENNSKTANESRPALGTCKSQKPIKEWDTSYKIQVRQFIEAQLVTYTLNSKGWIFWNWKTESAPEWDYLALSEHNLFPTPFNNYTYFYENGTFKDNSTIETLGTDGSLGIDPTTPRSGACGLSALNPLLPHLEILNYFISHKAIVLLLGLGLVITL